MLDVKQELREVATAYRIMSELAAIGKWPKRRLPDNYLVIDTETLGFSSQRDRVVQIGMCLVQDGEFCHELWNEDYLTRTLKWPKEDFVGKEEAIGIHHCDYEYCQENGVEPVSALSLLQDIITWACDRQFYLVGHNIHKFDIPFLVGSMKRSGFALTVCFERVIDTAMFVKGMQLGMLPSRDDKRFSDYWSRVGGTQSPGVYFNLARYCVARFGLDQKYGVDVTQAHGAGYDCWLAHLVVRELNALVSSVYTEG